MPISKYLVDPRRSRAEIRRWLEMIGHEPYVGPYIVPVTALAAYCGLDKATIFEFRRGDDAKLGSEALEKLSRAIDDVEDRRVIFFDRRVPNSPEEKFRYLEPPDLPPMIPRLAGRDSWSIFACCRSCGGNKFMPVEMHGRPYVACYKCFPPSQYLTVGATARNPKELSVEFF